MLNCSGRNQTCMPIPESIVDLIERFECNREDYRSPTYNETRLRREFLDPFFTALGWDVDNEQGYAEAYKDVIHEDSLRVEDTARAPDYCFRIGGQRKFFVEAKKPAVNIRDDTSPAYQLRRYAWSAKLPLSILSDFEEFAVYDCRVKPEKDDKASTARIKFIKHTEYADRWDEIAGVFSPDAIRKGSFDKFAQSTRLKRGTAQVDDAILEEIESWRDMLARNIALRNPGLSSRMLNYAVQSTIDRIVFLRICEGRGIEQYGLLMALQNGVNVYPRLVDLFKKADFRYNSGLFHFKIETGRPEPDTVTPNLKIDDAVLKNILKRIYYPESPYEFSVIPPDILGQVYERFLGKVIRLTPGGQAKVEDKPEVRKAGGVYYTPTYIVEYIVKNTVGKLLEGKRPQNTKTARVAPTRGASPARVAPTSGASPRALLVGVPKLRILDPACGSGSFLIGAYQYLLDWHLKAYTEDGDPEKLSKKRKAPIYRDSRGDWRLDPSERKRILTDHIYGVDIDSQAVEVTKLSLLLKVLEGENEENISSNLRLFHERALPDLDGNIKCGNSLIGPDFYANAQMMLLTEEEQYRINVFDWKKEFAEVFKGDNPGFDAVIGNPPYVRQESLGEFKAYFQERYQTYNSIADLYTYFIERGVSLLNENGIFGYIVANKWMRANYGEPLRKWLKTRSVEEIIDFGDLPVFKQATTYPCILVIRNAAPGSSFYATKVESLEFDSLTEYVQQDRFKVAVADLSDNEWKLDKKDVLLLLRKISSKGVPLSEYVKGKIFYGIKTGLNEAFVIDEKTKKKLITEDPRSAELIKPFLLGRDIKRYQPPETEHYLIFMPKGWTRLTSQNAPKAWEWLKANYPSIASHLASFQSAGMKRGDKGEYWWELRACDYYAEFEKPKIIYPNICKQPEFAFDDSNVYTNQKCFIIPTTDKYLLGLLNSSLIFLLFRTMLPKLRGDFYEPSYVYFKDFPIRPIDFSNPSDRKRHDLMVNLVDRMLDLHKKLRTVKTPHEKETLQRQIDATDQQIDRLVYELYELTEEEIKIVEGVDSNG